MLLREFLQTPGHSVYCDILFHITSPLWGLALLWFLWYGPNKKNRHSYTGSGWLRVWWWWRTGYTCKSTEPEVSCYTFIIIYLANLLFWYPLGPLVQVPFSSRNGVFSRLRSILCQQPANKFCLCISNKKGYCFEANKISSLPLLFMQSTNT